MQEEIAKLVFPIISHGLRLKERVDNTMPHIDSEQATLRSFLLDPQSERLLDFAGDPAIGERASVDRFLGGRYALACWLDEILIDTPNQNWSRAWTDRKMETSLFGTNERAWWFWEQARKAELRATPDALEIYYLCVMLGFRGEKRNQSQQVNIWRYAVEERFTESGRWRSPNDRQVITHVPPLRGQARFRRMLVVCCILVGALIPVASFLLVSWFGGT
jgi:type VI secretion system protein ImpK